MQADNMVWWMPQAFFHPCPPNISPPILATCRFGAMEGFHLVHALWMAPSIITCTSTILKAIMGMGSGPLTCLPSQPCEYPNTSYKPAQILQSGGQTPKGALQEVPHCRGRHHMPCTPSLKQGNTSTWLERLAGGAPTHRSTRFPDSQKKSLSQTVLNVMKRHLPTFGNTRNEET